MYFRLYFHTIHWNRYIAKKQIWRGNVLIESIKMCVVFLYMRLLHLRLLNSNNNAVFRKCAFATHTLYFRERDGGGRKRERRGKWRKSPWRVFKTEVLKHTIIIILSRAFMSTWVFINTHILSLSFLVNWYGHTDVLFVERAERVRQMRWIK